LGASSAFPKRFGTLTSDTLVARAAPFDASHAKDALHLPRVNAAGFHHPGCLPSTKCDRGALTAVARDHSFHRRFRGDESSTTRHLRATLPPRIGFRALFSAWSRPAFAFRALRRRHRSSDD